MIHVAFQSLHLMCPPTIIDNPQMQISLITKLKLQYDNHIFAASCFKINKKIMFSFQVSSLEKDQSLCRELIKSRGKTISLLLNEIPFIVTIDTCSFSKTSDDTVTYNPDERKTATGNAGTATIYWVDAHMVTWGITSNAGGAMVFTGTVSTNRGQIFVLGDIEFDGDCGGTNFTL